ncbi:hypothetical protein [Pseudanabaena sp. FACHB-2040]|uniref:hypothetical protein n=1 Tax=Pseudanabaena sp. FACHB-2040 TaxID=2692859 RepID=UPI001687C49C|nr:hypothetical protein [Pseudanabaena sp. FACHB-2040]MBD2257694.1 hypothetical protein [Pseudanabaena sp. FACHB-2040]
MRVGYLGLGLVLFMLLIFGILQWWQIPVGSFADWVVAGATFGWLLTITTVPWNIHFEAKEAVGEAALSAERGIAVDSQQIAYVRLVARRSLWAAVLLHLVSALGLYGLAIANVSQIGYWGSAAALLLTLLRPAVRTYQYFAARIAQIRRQFQYPREDVVELRDRITQTETALELLQTRLDSENPASWAATQQRQWEALRADLTTTMAELSTLKATNQAEHERLSREARNAIAQLSTDGQVLEHVREIIRFFKTA